jgi:hypothetical protein
LFPAPYLLLLPGLLFPAFSPQIESFVFISILRASAENISQNHFSKQHKNPFECRLSGSYNTFCALGAALQWLILQRLHDKTVHEISAYYSKLVSDIDYLKSF